MPILSRSIMLKATKKNNLLELKTQKGSSRKQKWKKKQKEKRRRFKVKTQKGGLDHIKKKEKVKLKTRKGGLTKKRGS